MAGCWQDTPALWPQPQPLKAIANQEAFLTGGGLSAGSQVGILEPCAEMVLPEAPGSIPVPWKLLASWGLLDDEAEGRGGRHCSRELAGDHPHSRRGPLSMRQPPRGLWMGWGHMLKRGAS